MVTFDPSISYGVLIQTAVVIGGGLLTLGALRANVSGLKIEVSRSNAESKKSIEDNQAETRRSLEGVQDEIKKIGSILVNQADQNRRIIHLEDDLRQAALDIRELRHLRGIVLPVNGDG